LGYLLNIKELTVHKLGAVMRSLLNFISDHPVITIAYCMYAMIWFLIALTGYRIDQLTPDQQRNYCGMGLVFGFFFAIGLTIIYLLITLLQAVFLKKDRALYLKLSLFIFVPAAIITVIGYL
jgi:hypothetical protein